jgi:hypothetical protein
MTLAQVAEELTHRLASIFLRDENSRRPVYGETSKFQSDPHWRDYILFYEYFHGDNGAGIGASHQTGWTGTVAALIQLLGAMTPEMLLAGDAVAKPYQRPGAAAAAAPLIPAAKPRAGQEAAGAR